MSNPTITSAQIFVIDNAPSNLVLVLSILRRAGFTNALPFTDAQTALDAVTHVPPDLVLVDLDMPGNDIAAFTAALRAHGRSVPVMGLSSDGAGEHLTTALRAGVTDYASKPVNESEVLLRVRNLLLIRDRVDGQAEAETAAATEPALEDEPEDDAQAMRAIIAAGGPDIVFQPIVDLASGNTVGLEALARFGTDAHPPEQWFAYAATLGLGIELEVAAIAAALQSLDRLDPASRLALNLSPVTLADDRLRALLAGTDPHRLVFELPERVAVSDYEALRATTARWQSDGALICVDDAAADADSLRHVLAVAPDIVKLDIALTRGIDTDPVKRTLARSLQHLAGEIGATITAEGIETQAEVDALRELGIARGQGFHFARPAPLAPVAAPVPVVAPAVTPAPEPLPPVSGRAALHDAIALMLARGRRVTAFAIDLDRFAEVNGTYGRDVGDEVLRTTKARLEGTLRPGHIVSPVGGDAFVVVSDTIADEHEARTLARRIHDVLARRIGFAAIQVEVTAGIGIAVAADASPAHLLAAADAALETAKQSGPGSIAFGGAVAPEPRLPA